MRSGNALLKIASPLEVFLYSPVLGRDFPDSNFISNFVWPFTSNQLKCVKHSQVHFLYLYDFFFKQKSYLGH